MKRIYILTIAIAFSLLATASSVPVLPVNNDKKVPNAKLILIPIGTSGKTISLYELSKLSRPELERITGKKMSLFERMAFQRTKHRLAKGIKEDGSIQDKKLSKAFAPEKDRTRGFHGLGFVLGFFLGVIGVVLAYVIDNEEDKDNRAKWAWIGFGIAFLLTAGLYIILFAAFL